MGRRDSLDEARLRISWRGEAVMEFTPAAVSIGIGSSTDNDICLSGVGIEPHHLVLRRRGRRWIALARGGGLLTDGDGGAVRQARLAPGRRIGLGGFGVEVLQGRSPGTPDGTGTLAESSRMAGRPRMALSVHDGSAGRLLRLDGQGVTLGRDSTCDITIDDPYISLVHARVAAGPGGWILADMGSRNGTRVDGRRVDGAEIEPGCTLVIGRTLIRCVDADPRAEFAGGWVETPGLREVVEEVARFATTSLPVLITGESGVGKEGLARMLHEAGHRSRGPFVPVNCGALPEGLADSLLFGHVRGAFTGAHEDRPGLVQASSGGTLFLDEVGELTGAAQSRLLRVIEEGLVRPLGSNSSTEVDLRIVSATHRDLMEGVGEGVFRLDLLHRLAVLTTEVPPLRKRTADIGVLAHWLLERAEVPAAGISAEAMEILRAYHWPGNVRELRNVLFRAALRSGGGVLLPAHLAFMGAGATRPAPRPGLPSTVAEASALLARTGGNVAGAARSIGVARSTLRDHLRRLGVRSCDAEAAGSFVGDG